MSAATTPIAHKGLEYDQALQHVALGEERGEGRTPAIVSQPTRKVA